MPNVICESPTRSASRAEVKPASAPLLGVSSPARALWYCLRVRHRHEFATRDVLRGAGIEEFLPTFAVSSAWSDRTAVVTKPLFPGYCFARFDAAQKAQVFVRGVLEILSLDNSPVPIPDDVIEAIQIAVLSPRPVVCCPYVAGASVTVSRGPFAGRTGVVIRTSGATTLFIPVEILGRSVPVELDAKDVAPC
jgi:transcription antitermination factor NusG